MASRPVQWQGQWWMEWPEAPSEDLRWRLASAEDISLMEQIDALENEVVATETSLGEKLQWEQSMQAREDWAGSSTEVHERKGRSGNDSRLGRQERRIHLQSQRKLETIALVGAHRAGGVFIEKDVFALLGQRLQVIERGEANLSPEADRTSRVTIGHAEGMPLAFANIYADLAEAIRAEKEGRPKCACGPKSVL